LVQHIRHFQMVLEVGKCPLGHLGPIANADGRFKVEIRNFDQTVIGKPAHDLIRLGLSLAAAAVVSDLPGLTIAEILEAMIAQYEAAFHARSTAKRRPGLRAIWRRSWGRRTGGKCRATIEGRGKELRRNRAKALNAPSWLWRSVVDLLP
jgi:uncharacterized protein (DUF2252 family)